MSKKLVKNISLLIVSLLLISSVLTGCGNSKSNTSAGENSAPADNNQTSSNQTSEKNVPKQTIRIMTRWTGADANAPVLQELIQEFNSKEANIEIIDESIADAEAYDSKISAGVASGNVPHIFQVWSPYEYAKNGVLLDLKPYLDEDKEWSEGFIGGIIDAVGKFKDLPGRYVVPMESNYEVSIITLSCLQMPG